MKADDESRRPLFWVVCYRASGGILATNIVSADEQIDGEHQLTWRRDGDVRYVVPREHFETSRAFRFRKEADDFALEYRRQQHELGRRTPTTTASLEEANSAASGSPKAHAGETSPVIEGVAVQFAGIGKAGKKRT